MTVAFTFHLDERVIWALDKLAAQTEQTRDRLVEKAIENYLTLQTWQVAKIEAGIAAADRGDFVRDDELDRLRAKFTEARRQSLAIAERSRDPNSDDHEALSELDALFEADHFASDWKA